MSLPLDCYFQDYDVVCPKCAAKAVAKTAPLGKKGTYRECLVKYVVTRILCPACGFNREMPSQQGQNDEDYTFWYACEFKGHRLWAVNLSHVQFLIAVVSGEVSEKALPLYHQSVIEAWPTWLKLAKNRDEVLRILRQWVRNGV